MSSQTPIDASAQFRYFFDALPIGAAVLSRDGHVQIANSALGDFLGYAPMELEGVHFATITITRDQPTDLAQFERLIAGEIESYTMHKHYRPKIGQPRPGRLIARKTPWGDPDSLLVLGFVLPLDAFEAAGISDEDRRKMLEQVVGERIIATWRVWVPILGVLVGVSNLDAIIGLFTK